MALRPPIAARLTSIRRRIPAIALGVFLALGVLSLGLTAMSTAGALTSHYAFGDLVDSPTANPASGNPPVPSQGPYVFHLHLAMAMVQRGDLSIGLQTMEYTGPHAEGLRQSQQANLGWRFSSMGGGGNWWNAPKSIWDPPWEVQVLGFGFYKIKPPIDCAGIKLHLPTLGGFCLLAAAIIDYRRRVLKGRLKRGLCVRCGYSREGLADAACCPECGAFTNGAAHAKPHN